MQQFRSFNPLASIAGVQGVASQAQGIRSQRQGNQLQEILQPLKVQQAQAQGREINMDEAGREAQYFMSALGDVDPSTPEGMQAAQQRWSAARQALGQVSDDVDEIPEQFDPQAYQTIQGIAAQYGGQGDRGFQFGAQETFKDEKGNLFFGTQKRNPSTGMAETVLSPVGGGSAQPVGSISMVGRYGLTAPEAVTQKAQEAGATRTAEADVDLKTRPEIEGAVAAAKAQAKLDESRSEAARNLEDLQGSLTRMRELTEDGIYTGAAGDRLIKGLASGGIVFDQEKLNRTTRVRQIATNLKFMAKPTGMGAMSDSEWAIIKEAIPDPDSATAGQLLAGLDEFERRLQERAGQMPEEGGAASGGQIKFLGFE